MLRRGNPADVLPFETHIVVKPPLLPTERQFTTPMDGFESLTGWLTTSVTDPTMVLVEDDASLGYDTLIWGIPAYLLLAPSPL